MLSLSFCRFPDESGLTLRTEPRDRMTKLFLRNPTPRPVKAGELTIATSAIPYPADRTRVYGEGASKLSQYEGTLTRFHSITRYSDTRHYKLPRPDDCFVCSNLVILSPEGGRHELLGFVSCRRFHGRFYLTPSELKIILNCEGIEVPPGGEVELEHLFHGEHDDREMLLSDFASSIAVFHPRLKYEGAVTGWCSWSCYGPSVTEDDVLSTLRAIQEKLPELRFIQIDDGYQAHMGDWLDSAPGYPEGVGALCRKIKNAGFEPAIWVAPFIAEGKSTLFRTHPDWFVRDESGLPLDSSRVTFGGWRCAPWYILDGTHPEARNYLRTVFSVMRNEWGCRYFKLDANFWGAMPFGHRFAPQTTSVEAYRLGMAAILEGAGADSLLLGCNAPMWPSLGTCHAMRISDDVARTPQQFRAVARECFYRNWQHNRLWINDPDCILLLNLSSEVPDPAGQMVKRTTNLSQDAFAFHRAHILASGGMVLSGDKITEMPPETLAILRKVLQGARASARFVGNDFSYAIRQEGERTLHFYFNWNEYGEQEFLLPDPERRRTDYWTGIPLPQRQRILTVPAFSASVIVEE